jgi:hypothetical protein
VTDSWIADDSTICIVYREGWFDDGLLSLRRQIEPDVPLDVVIDEILQAELGEPLGSLADELVVDQNGVHWLTESSGVASVQVAGDQADTQLASLAARLDEAQ